MPKKENPTFTPEMIKAEQEKNPFAKLVDIVYQILESQILSTRLMPGSKLRINSIADELNVSATPVREAIEQLDEMGLVISSKTKGKYKTYTVFDIDDKEVADLFTVRKSIESTSAYICAQRNWDVDISVLEGQLEDFLTLTQKYIDGGSTLELSEIDITFHRAIVSFTGNTHLEEIYDSLSKRLQYLSIRTCDFMTGAPRKEDLRMLYVQHKAVVNAIKMGFPELAREAMVSHIDYCAENCIKNRYILERRSID